ncbi:GntR family transcriptional regulator [uncultured Aquabacterium sp.]|jgi:DNA-binding GntR family transcriptional regulator|uniref:GntR family transcriptional regulator n=1 Tax=uncultured Aquabacterium sp. TaxID=158753 RepID=UPI0026057266|nr:GntR family transcriptional regulator [uncultured Aquabacterium sp.]
MSAARKPPPSPDTVAATGVSAEADVAPARRPPLTKADAEAIPMPVADAEGSDSPTSTEHIVHAVTRAIVEHRLLPGAKLVEQKIADRFGVSRTIVRQAFNRLSELKLVRLEPARGAFVAAPSIEEAREVFAVRRMVEGQMLRELIARIKPGDLRELKAHLKAERDAVKRIDVPSRSKLLFDFHVELARVLGNQVLVDLIQELVSRCSLITLMYQSADDAETSHAEHIAILQAIEARDADRAAALVDAHLLTVERQLTQHPRAPGVVLGAST